jgi:hypothetical protein
MTSDIRLEDEQVVVEGKLYVQEIASSNNQLKFTGYDFLLDYHDRRKQGSDPTQFRRALVHDYGDRLTLNYGEDYPGGVGIQGSVYVHDVYPLENSKLGGVGIHGSVYINDLYAFENSKLFVNNDLWIVNPKAQSPQEDASLRITNRTIFVSTQDAYSKETVLDLVQTIQDLQARVATLEKKIAGVPT